MAFDLNQLGWDAKWARVFAQYAAEGLLPARVAIEFNYIYRLYAESGELQAQHAGRLRHQAEGRENMSAVGDWVAVLPTPGEAAGTIEAVLPRRSRFSRKVAGETTEEQIVAANIDTVFIVMGLDGDYNPRRLERYLLMASESGARPVVLLNKSDVAEHLADDLDEIARSTAGIPVHAISARERLTRPPHHPSSPLDSAGPARPADRHARHARTAVVDPVGVSPRDVRGC